MATLRPGEVHIWIVPLTTAAIAPAEILSGEEERRAARYKFDSDRRRYRNSHLALRCILAGYTGVPPSELEFDVEAAGRPRLAGEAARSGFEFSLSHSQELAAIGITVAARVGIDIEKMRTDLDVTEIAAAAYAPEEAERIRELSGEARTAVFYACWTIREALAKCSGAGLGVSMGRRLTEELAGRHVQVFLPEAGFTGALAAEAPVETVSFFRLDRENMGRNPRKPLMPS
jgi:4'-phosphopantetheinyl transferase